MNDLNDIQCTDEIKRIFETFADNGTPFIIVCIIMLMLNVKYAKVKLFSSVIDILNTQCVKYINNISSIMVEYDYATNFIIVIQ